MTDGLTPGEGRSHGEGRRRRGRLTPATEKNVPPQVGLRGEKKQKGEGNRGLFRQTSYLLTRGGESEKK